MLWLFEMMGCNLLIYVGFLLQQMMFLMFVIGIVNIYYCYLVMVVQLVNMLVEQFGGCFVFGFGVLYVLFVSGLCKIEYGKLVMMMCVYFELYGEVFYLLVLLVEKVLVVIVVFGFKMLELVGEFIDGVYFYLMIFEYIVRVCEIFGLEKWLCVEQKVIFCIDVEKVWKVVCEMFVVYIGLLNYYKNWFCFGFEEVDLVDGGSDCFIDVFFVWGDEDVVQV